MSETDALRIAFASGFGMALLYSIWSVFPIIEVASWQTFALKIITVILVANLIGLGSFHYRCCGFSRKRNRD